MSETVATTEPVEPPSAATEPVDPESEAPEEKAGAEAAKYRVRLREAETQRDALAQQVERMQRSTVAMLVAESLAVPADLFDVGKVQLADLLDPETGDVDPSRVGDAVQALLQSRPNLRPYKFPDFGQGQREFYGTPVSWSAVLKAQ